MSILKSKKYYRRLNMRIEFFKDVFEDITKRSKIEELSKYIQHGTTSRYLHSVAVAYYSYQLALFLQFNVKEKDLIRGALLHDYYLYDSKIGEYEVEGLHGFSHPKVALHNAMQEFDLTHMEKDIVLKHMFPLTIIPPIYAEGLLVSLIDKACAVYEFFIRKNQYALINCEILNDASSNAKPVLLLKPLG